VVSSPVVSSIRSRQTGQVGSSIKCGSGGGKGVRTSVVVADVNGSCDIWGNDVLGVLKVMDLMKITWQVSGCENVLVLLY